MGDTLQSALIKTQRALDAHFRLADDMASFREMVGEAINLEKTLVEMRASRDALTTDVEKLKAEKLAHIGEMAKTKQAADADAVATRSAAESWAADVRKDAERLKADADGARRAAAETLAQAAIDAAIIVDKVQDEAKAIAAGKTREVEDLNALIAQRKQEFMALTAEFNATEARLEAARREFANLKARLG
jgi:SMC interacting uncharacterized protein involved in chromosome segregation